MPAPQACWGTAGSDPQEKLWGWGVGLGCRIWGGVDLVRDGPPSLEARVLAPCCW